MPVVAVLLRVLTVLLSLVRVEADPAPVGSVRILTAVEVFYYLLGIAYFLLEIVRAS